MIISRTRSCLTVALLLLLSPALMSGSSHADGDFATDAQKTGAEKVGADAAVADPRLPPVFPGEEVRDGNNTIKVWSTSGNVAGSEVVGQPQNNAPNNYAGGNNNYAGGNNGLGGVIVDTRRNNNSNNGNSSGTSNSQTSRTGNSR